MKRKARYLMKEYTYVNIHIGMFVGAKSEEHRAMIDQYAAKGYRYVGYIPTKISDYGKIKDMDLITVCCDMPFQNPNFV